MKDKTEVVKEAQKKKNLTEAIAFIYMPTQWQLMDILFVEGVPFLDSQQLFDRFSSQYIVLEFIQTLPILASVYPNF